MNGLARWANRLLKPRKQADGDHNYYVGDPDPHMVVAITVECNVRDIVLRGDRQAAVARLESRIQVEFGEFQMHLAEQGLDAMFRINRRVTIGR